MKKFFTYIFLVIIITYFPLYRGFAENPNQITGVEYSSTPDHTRFFLTVSGDLDYKFFSLNNPYRFVMDFKNTAISFPAHEIPVTDGIVSQIRFGSLGKNVLRIVFDLIQPVEPKIFALDSNPGKPNRIVIDLFRPDLKARAEENRSVVRSPQPAKKIIVIDPGHGGEDPGAVGSGKTKEKDLVLEFSRILKKLFDENNDYQVFLTRNGDYFLPLQQRTRIAEDHKADLFISVHADSNYKKGTHGCSVYCLSLKGASDEATRCLAEKENASDLIGGITLSENADLNLTLLDLALTNNINSSLRLGALVLKEIGKVHSVKFDKPKQAGFRVLKTAKTPAVLLELGFISNPNEARMLRQGGFQDTVAQAILRASDQFLELMSRENPNPEVLNNAGNQVVNPQP